MSAALPLRKMSDTALRARAQQLVHKAGIMDEKLRAKMEEALVDFPLRSDFEQFLKKQRSDYEIGVRYPEQVFLRFISLLGTVKNARILLLGEQDGFFAALLTALGARVFVLEPNPQKAQGVRKLLDTLGYQQVVLRPGRLDRGWAEHGPYDGIFTLFVVDHLPQNLETQLVSGGKVFALQSCDEGRALQLVAGVRKGRTLESFAFEKFRLA